MPLSQFLFETGPDGVALSNANSGSSASSLGSGTTTFSTAMAAHGNFGARFQNAAGGATYRRWPFTFATNTFQFSGVLTYPGVPAQAIDVGAFINSAAARRLFIRIHESGELRLVSTGGTSYPLVAAGGLTAGTKVRVAIQAVGGSTTASTIQAQAYTQSTPGKWDSPIGTAVNTSSANLSTDDLIGIDAGVLTSATNSYTVGWDDLQLHNGVGSEIPDYGATSDTLAANAGAHQSVVPGATVILDGSASTGANSYQWSFVWPSSGAPALTGSTTNSASFVAGSNGSVYALRLEVGNGTDTATATVNVAVVASESGGIDRLWTGTQWK